MVVESLEQTQEKTFSCPDSHWLLNREDGFLISPITGRRFPIDNGIPNFLRYAPMEDSGTVESLTNLTSLARQKGWRKYRPHRRMLRPHG